jgi:VIT1/CCC1 family predicted Fe2+/Mn2+ transporter
LTSAFPSIADLPGDPYNSRYCTLPQSSGQASHLDPLRTFLKTHLPKQLTYTRAEMHAHDDEYISGKPPVAVSPLVDRLARFIVSFVGGASLVVPMIIMCLPAQDTTKSLIVTSVAVTLFAIVMALVMNASNAETLVATATYAAVLVVFVGTSS